ncbi:hypothetical protein BBJ28_00019783 [Nothophytophthora sp. Chile5]|nr:hypothetical protein BBJ28_00019783 [Nothophytophthora sp. Chile5]
MITTDRYESDYATSHSSGAVVLELLTFPSITGVSESGEPRTGVKRKASSLQQQQHEVRAIEQPRVNTVIEKPLGQRRSFVLPSETGVPPAEYHFKVSASDQQLIESGAKTLEIRLNVTPYSIIHVKDRITINGTVATTVVSIRKYSQLASVLATETLDALLPQGMQSGASSSSAKAKMLNASAAPLRYFRQFFSAEEEEQHGLVVFQLAATSSSAPKSMEDWTQLVYDQLETKRPAGCSMADLQFAFPTLPVDRIMEILTNVSRSL